MNKTVLCVVALGMVMCDSGTSTPDGTPTTGSELVAISSVCGGFGTTDSLQMFFPDTSEYCSTESIHWTFDTTTRRLHLTHTRVILNCAARMQAISVLNGEDLILSFYDTNTSTSADCLCPFDFYYEAVIPSDIAAVRVYYGPQQSTSALVNLTQSNGSFVVDAEGSIWCNLL